MEDSPVERSPAARGPRLRPDARSRGVPAVSDQGEQPGVDRAGAAG